jgi:hypothetical protein
LVGYLEATFETGSGTVFGKDSFRIRRHPGLISLFGLNSIIKKELSHPANSLPERAAKIKLFFGSGAPRLPDLFRAVQAVWNSLSDAMHTKSFRCAVLTQDLTAALS